VRAAWDVVTGMRRRGRVVDGRQDRAGGSVVVVGDPVVDEDPGWGIARDGGPPLRWRLFGAAWLVYLLSPASEIADRRSGGLAALGYVLLAVFAVLYAPMVFHGTRFRYPSFGSWTPFVLFVLGCCVLPIAGESGFATFVFVAASSVAMLPRKPALVFVAFLIALAAALPEIVPGWDDDGGAQAGQIVLSAAIIIGMVSLIKSNRALAQARTDLARLAVLEERQRVGRDIHDVLGHSLTVITMKAALARRVTTTDPGRAMVEMAEVEQIARRAVGDIKRTVSGNREVSLVAELSGARIALAAAGTDADLPLAGAVEQVRPELRELFGWVVREGVTNVLRHSGATRCAVHLGPDSVEVCDDGAGRTASSVPGNGLRGLTERAAAVGALLETACLPEGFRLRVFVPDPARGREPLVSGGQS
jgi:two-component system sensor histidine kinase DesK